MKILLTLDGIDIAFILFFIVAVVAMWLLYQRRQQPQLASPASGLSLRKVGPYLVFAGLGLLFVFSLPLAYNFLFWLAVHVRGLSPLATATGASPAEIWAEAQLDGWPSVGRATGKLIMAAAFFALSSIQPWLMQKLTHPAVARFKAKLYTAVFDSLPGEAQLAEASRVDNRAALRMSICILAAAVIN